MHRQRTSCFGNGAPSYDSEHAEFWADKDVPDSWTKFRDIALYWLDKGVDGFRYDMAEMVPVEFWSYLNSSIKAANPDAFLLAEVYNPALYRDYIFKGRMDYLYDKVGFYDTLKPIMQDRTGTEGLAAVHAQCPGLRPVLRSDDRMLDLGADADVALRPSNTPPEDAVGRKVGRIAWAVYSSAEVPQQGEHWVVYQPGTGPRGATAWRRRERASMFSCGTKVVRRSFSHTLVLSYQ